MAAFGRLRATVLSEQCMVIVLVSEHIRRESGKEAAAVWLLLCESHRQVPEGGVWAVGTQV